jgi:hypothetical protein
MVVAMNKVQIIRTQYPVEFHDLLIAPDGKSLTREGEWILEKRLAERPAPRLALVAEGHGQGLSVALRYIAIGLLRSGKSVLFIVDDQDPKVLFARMMDEGLERSHNLYVLGQQTGAPCFPPDATQDVVILDVDAPDKTLALIPPSFRVIYSKRSRRSSPY